MATNLLPPADAPKDNAVSSADAAGSTIDKIKKSGTIVLGYRDASIPFSYIADDPNKPIGYAHDLQLKVVDALKNKSIIPDLKVRYNLVTHKTAFH